VASSSIVNDNLRCFAETKSRATEVQLTTPAALSSFSVRFHHDLQDIVPSCGVGRAKMT